VQNRSWRKIIDFSRNFFDIAAAAANLSVFYSTLDYFRLTALALSYQGLLEFLSLLACSNRIPFLLM
jgi:hypothetical protein